MLHERLDHPEEGVVLDDRVRVHRAEERVAGDVDPGVEGVRLPALLLVDDDEVGHQEVAVEAADVARRDRPAVDLVHAPQLEGLDQALERPVGRPVVDDDHLELAVVDHLERADRLDDRLLLVVGRHEDRDRPGQVR
jgi:hypothetical protein